MQLPFTPAVSTCICFICLYLLYLSKQTILDHLEVAWDRDLDVLGSHAFDFLSDLPEPFEEQSQPQALSSALQDFDNSLHILSPDPLPPVHNMSSEDTFTNQQLQASRAEIIKIANRRAQRRFRENKKACCRPDCSAIVSLALL